MAPISRMFYTLLLLLCMTPVVFQDAVGADRRLSVYKKNTLDELGQFESDRRMYIYETIDELSRKLYKSPYRKRLKTSKTTTFERFPNLELTDVDGDGAPDLYAYVGKPGGNTPDFGFMYDLNRDGKTDYLTYNQGMGLMEPLEFVWTFYHLIDSDYDGTIDIWVLPDVDSDRDSRMDRGVTAWLYDTKRDGKFDTCEHLGDEIQKTIPMQDGKFNIECVIRDTIEADDTWWLERANKMLSDINAMMD